jgi:DNA polymerase-3 subunit chi
MTERVDFYVLKGDTERRRWLVACRLAEKAYLADQRVVVLSASHAEAAALDELLWTFDERSFVPHRLHPATAAPDAATPGAATPGDSAGTAARPAGAPPVEIAAADPGAAPAAWVGAADLLVNLTNRTPDPIGRFARIAEIVDSGEERRRSGRERFKYYRDLKISLEAHQLDHDGP